MLIIFILLNSKWSNFVLDHIGGVVVNMLTSTVVDGGFDPQFGQSKDYKIDICWFFVKHTALGSKSAHWLARYQDNMFEWSDMSNRWLLFQWASTIKIQLNVLV